ncbi:MAG: DUF4114 domain-containing protein, partial [Planctomycetota bacterium]
MITYRARISPGNAVSSFLVKSGMLALSLFLCSDLIETWGPNKSEAFGGIGFVCWLATLLLSSTRIPDAVPDRPFFVSAALMVSVVGEVVAVNALQHLGLVVLLVSLTTKMGNWWLGIFTGLLWLPVVGYCETYCIGHSMVDLRVGIIVLGMCLPLRSWIVNPSPLFAANARLFLLGVSLAGWLSCPKFCNADEFTYSPVQSSARPFGLDIIDLVALEGSDSASSDFMDNQLESFQNLVDENLSERREASLDGNSSLIALDPTRMTLSEQTTVRAYFVGEGAGYHNTLGFNADGLGVDSGNPFLVFPDASSPRSYLSSGRKKRTVSEPLMPGDFVQLGEFGAGTLLDFFLIANGARGGTNVYGAPAERNPDGLDHIVAFAQVENPYVLIGFED